METEPTAIEVSFGEEELQVQLNDGRKIGVPLSWFPRLSNASPEQRRKFELIGDGEFIHWPEIDEDLSVAGLLVGWHPGLKSTVARRKDSSHGHVLNERHFNWTWNLPAKPAPFRPETDQSIHMFGGAISESLGTWDAIVEDASQRYLLVGKWWDGGMTLQKLAGTVVPQSVRAFNPEAEGRMPQAA